MKVRVVKGPWGYSPRGFDHEVAATGSIVDLPDAVAASAIEAGAVKPVKAKAAASAPETAAAKQAPEQG